MNLTELIHSHVRGLDREPVHWPVDPVHCLEVTTVAPRSVASAAGVAVGDWLEYVNGRKAVELGVDVEGRELGDVRNFTFHRPGSRERLKLATSDLPLGIRLEPTTQAIVAGFAMPKSSFEDLEPLWRRGLWADLARLGEDEMRFRAKLPREYADVFRKRNQDPRDTPTLVLLGSALYELGRREDGLALVREYDERFAGHWTAQFMAISAYVHGREAERAGDLEEARRRYKCAHEHSRCDRFAEALTALGAPAPEWVPEWVGRKWPVPYELRRLDGAEKLNLRRCLGDLAPGQLLGVCLLASYRANGPYNSLMLTYQRVARHLAHLIAGLHVVTMRSGSHKGAMPWLSAEITALQQGASTDVLLDADGTVTRALHPQGSPHLYLLRPDGEVVHEGSLDGVELWRALDAAFGAAESLPGLEASRRRPGFSPLEASIRREAEQARLWAAGIVHQRLDYSVASLACLDRVLEKLRSTRVDDGQRGRVASAVHQGLGAYLGEVMRRELGGGWEERPTGDGSLAPVLVIRGEVMAPHMVVLAILCPEDFSKATGKRPPSSAVGYYLSVAQRMHATMPEVRESESAATNAPATWPRIDRRALKTDDNSKAELQVATELASRLPASTGGICKLAAFRRHRCLDRGFLHIPMLIAGAERPIPVFVYGESFERPEEHFAAARRLCPELGFAEPVYFASNVLSESAPEGQIFRPFEASVLGRWEGELPPGAYALWWAAKDSALASESPGLVHIRRFYEAADGISTYLLGRIGSPLGIVQQERASRVKLPDSRATVAITGPDDLPALLSLDAEQGLQFLLHVERTSPALRDRFWRHVADFAEKMRTMIQEHAWELDSDSQRRALSWWRLTEAVTQRGEFGATEYIALIRIEPKGRG